MQEYFGYLVLVIVALILGTAFTLLGILLGPKKRSHVKDQPFETGLKYLPSSKRVQVKFYLVAMVFLIFDVEIAFLYPYAIKAKEYGLVGFILIFTFLLILSVGILYEWKKKVTTWE